MSVRRHRDKPHSRRCRKPFEEKHWLGEGCLGQQCLLADFSPALYVVDRVLASIAVSVAHSYSGNEEKPFALFVPPPGDTAWQIAHLSKYFNLYVYSTDREGFLAEAVDRFGAKLVRGALDTALTHELELFLHTESSWNSPEVFLAEVRESRSFLSSEGKACFLVLTRKDSDGYWIVWENGSETSLEDWETGSLFLSSKPQTCKTLVLSELDPFDSELLASFLRRNRDFFGRNMRDSFQQRMKESDFMLEFSPNAEVVHCVSVLVYGADSK